MHAQLQQRLRGVDSVERLAAVDQSSLFQDLHDDMQSMGTLHMHREWMKSKSQQRFLTKCRPPAFWTSESDRRRWEAQSAKKLQMKTRYSIGMYHVGNGGRAAYKAASLRVSEGTGLPFLTPFVTMRSRVLLSLCIR